MQVQNLTTDELKKLIREIVTEVIEEFLPDPDESKTLKEEFKQELLNIRKRREMGIRGISSKDVMHRLGLDE